MVLQDFCLTYNQNLIIIIIIIIIIMIVSNSRETYTTYSTGRILGKCILIHLNVNLLDFQINRILSVLITTSTM